MQSRPGRLEAGSILGGYEITAPLGAGGMGEVYRARDSKLGRDVAVKLLLEDVAGDSGRLARFEREARVLASLNHPRIATLHGYERDAEISYLVMELVDGETLAERIARGSLPQSEAIEIFTAMAEGLDAAHDKGVIHRDLKPANIKLSSEGEVKILDFGLAKAMDQSPDKGDVELSHSPTLTLEATRRGQILGTAAYMSPEQARGKPVDKRTDIWAFGCCLYEALTGHQPFRGEDAATTLARVLDRKPDWSLLEERADPRLVDLVRRCLEKEPRDRMRDIGDVRSELLSITHSPRQGARTPAGDVAHRRWPWAIGGALVGTLLTLAWSSDRGARVTSDERQVTRFEISLEGMQPTPSFEDGLVTLSPDGSLLALTMGVGPGSRTYLRPLDSLEPRIVEGGEFVWHEFFSPDSRWLGLGRIDRGFVRVPVAGGTALPLGPTTPNTYGGNWGADGRVAFSASRRSGISLISIDDGTIEGVTQPEAARGETGHAFPAPLPDGRGMVFGIWKEESRQWSVAAWSSETREVTTILEGGLRPRYLPTGHLVYGAENDLYAVPFDVETLQTRGTPVRVVESVPMFDEYGTACYSISDNGTLAYVPASSLVAFRRTVSWVTPDGRATQLPLEPENVISLALSPDGDRIAYAVRKVDDMDIYVYEIATNRKTQLTRNGFNILPVWAPDGSSVVFGSNRETTWKLFEQVADRGTDAANFTDRGLEANPGSFAEDGSFAFYALGDTTSYDIWTLSPGASDPEPFLATEEIEANPRFSSDGRWIAYELWTDGLAEVLVRPYPTRDSSSQWAVSTGGGSSPLWSPVRNELYYLSPGGKVMAVPFAITNDQFDPGAPRVLFERPIWTDGFPTPRFDIDPDGERFIVIDAPDHTKAKVVVVENWFEELKRLVPVD